MPEAERDGDRRTCLDRWQQQLDTFLAQQLDLVPSTAAAVTINRDDALELSIPFTAFYPPMVMAESGALIRHLKQRGHTAYMVFSEEDDAYRSARFVVLVHPHQQ